MRKGSRMKYRKREGERKRRCEGRKKDKEKKGKRNLDKHTGERNKRDSPLFLSTSSSKEIHKRRKCFYFPLSFKGLVDTEVLEMTYFQHDYQHQALHKRS